MDPISVLTLELWNKILEKLEDPLDRLNALEVLELPGLNEKRVGWLFAVTLPVILKQLDHYVYYYHKYDISLRQAFLSCRLVSRDCFNAVEKFVDKHWEDCDYSKWSPRERIHSLFLPNKQSTLRWNEVNLCFDQIKNHNLQTCPILTKHLRFLSYGPIEENSVSQTYAKSILGVLERIGPMLHSVKFYIADNSRENTRDFLPRALSLLPNLKNLVIEFVSFEEDDEEDEEDDEEDDDEEAEEDEEDEEDDDEEDEEDDDEEDEEDDDEEDEVDDDEEEEEPIILPNLPYLKTLLINPKEWIFPGTRISTCIPIHSYFPQITILQLDFNVWEDEYDQIGLFPNLERLFIEHLWMHQMETVRNLIKLLRDIDAPQLKYVSVNPGVSHYVGLNTLYDIALFERNLDEAVKGSISSLSERYPDKEWKSTSAIYEERDFCSMRFKIYDSAVIDVPPLKSKRTTREHQQRNGLIQRLANYLFPNPNIVL